MKILGLLCGFGVLLSQTSAFAQLTQPSVRLDTGLVAPLSAPQANRFGAGVAGTVKLAFNLTPWFDVGPTVGTIQLAPNDSNVPGSGVGGAWMFGVEARVKGSHTAPERKEWALSSPWLSVGAQDVQTGSLNRFGLSVKVGIAGPVDHDRHYWLGPYMGYDQVVDGTQFGGNSNLDHTDARVIEGGVSFEWDPVGRKHTPATPPVVEEKKVTLAPPPEQPPTPVPLPPPHPEYVEVTVMASALMHFDFDSSVLSDDSKTSLDDIAMTINQHLTAATDDPGQNKFKSIQVDGHASSENHPWAEKHNQKLSKARAQAVVDYLVSKGVPSNVLTSKGFGTSMPVASNDTEDGRRANRRVEFEVTVSFVRDSSTEGGK